MQPQPLIAVYDVQLSSGWYQAVLGGNSDQGGDEYEQIEHNGTIECSGSITGTPTNTRIWETQRFALMEMG